MSENEINGHPDKEWDLNFIQMTGEANRGALSVLSMYQVEDADEEDQIHTDYRLSYGCKINERFEKNSESEQSRV